MDFLIAQNRQPFSEAATKFIEIPGSQIPYMKCYPQGLKAFLTPGCDCALKGKYIRDCTLLKLLFG